MAEKKTASVGMSINSILSSLQIIRGIATNMESHQRFYPTDTFFQNVPGLIGRRIFWGIPTPPAKTFGSVFRSKTGLP